MRLIIFIGILSVQLSHWAVADTNQSLPAGPGPWVVIVQYENKAEALALKEFYDVWHIDGENKTLELMINDRGAYNDLISKGFEVKLHDKLMQQISWLEGLSPSGAGGINGFPCYRTVAETYATMADMAANYSAILELVDIGNTWHKNEPGGAPGYDMQVVKISNLLNDIENKPVLYAMGSIHAREYPPAELVTRFAEHLVNGYGSDPDITWLVDYHEIHLLLQGNPDGRIISEGEGSPFHRKNFNSNHCASGGGFGDMQGVDMNRNFGFFWNMGTGSSGSDCDAVFRGDTATSEPETQAIDEYIKTLFVDDRNDDLVSPAPVDKPGVYLDIHNYGGLTLFPFGFSNTADQAPNHLELQSLARRMSYYTGYKPEQSNATLGGADGASDDNAYGTLGVAAYTIELGSDSGFYTTCSYFESTVWPDNIPAMIYAAKAARMPYVLASGPDIINLSATVIKVNEGDTFVLSGTATDLQFENSNGSEPTHNITGVDAYVTIPSWLPGAIAINMSATDGSFNSKTEDFFATMDTSGLTAGRHTVWLEATDSTASNGVPSAFFLDVIKVKPTDIIFDNGFE